MGIRDLFRRQAPAPARRASISAQAATQSAGAGIIIDSPEKLAAFLRGEDTAAGMAVNTHTALSIAAVYGCVRIISGAVATLPLDIKRRVDEGTRQDATDHPLSRLIRRRPNGWQKPAQFKRHMQMSLLMRGNAYALRIPRAAGGVQALVPLNPDRVRVEQLATMGLRYHYRRPDGGEVTYRQDEVLHLVGMSLDGITGVSVLEYARETIGLALATRKHGAEYFRNGTNVGSWIKHPGKLGNEGLEFLHASLDRYRSDGDRTSGTLVLEEGAEFAPLGMSMEDAAFVDTMKLSRTDIAMFFGVPPHMLGDTEKSTSWGSGIEQQARGFVAYTLEDWLITWEEAITVDLAGDADPDIYARFNRAALVRGDLRTRYATYTQALQWGVMNPDEVRALEDMNPREDGKGGIYYDPPNTAGGGDAGDSDPAPAGGGNDQ